ncbi:MAG: SulP family inorganic anion transporter [Casimicrobiaceae bacterium]|nr:SulP family inorganic anion transporter [Casimicrobiaceae bacterium]
MSAQPATRQAGLTAYLRTALADDLVAAAIVVVLLVPQSMAYALLAGLPPTAGVLASLAPVVVYAVLGSSSTLAVGPVAVLAMMTAQAIVPVASAHGVSVELAAVVLAIEVGALLAVAALLRLEVLAALLAAPVLHGFIAGAALVIALGQLPALLGLPVRGNTLFELVPSAMAAPTLAPHPATAMVGVAALAALWLLRKYAARGLEALGLPRRKASLLARASPLLVIVAAILWVLAAPHASQGVALAGRVSLGSAWPPPLPWQADWAVWQALMPAAALIALVGYVESLAVAESLGLKRGERVSPRRELIGLSGANVAAGLTGGFPVTGGFARSIVNFDAGARTRMAGVFTAIGLLAAISLIGPWLEKLPKAVLAATIIIAVLSLLESHPFRQAWRWSRAEFWLMLLVAALTLLVGVEPALALGVVGSIALLLKRTARPHWAEVGRMPGTETFRNVKRFPEAETLPGVRVLRIDESLVFVNSRWLVDTVTAQTLESGATRHVVLMMSGVNDIDLSGLEALEQLAETLAARGVRLHLSELKGPLRDRFERFGTGWLTGRIFATQAQAHEALSASSSASEAGIDSVCSQTNG